ncbi:similar to Saccharomyces cerevisiae YOR280C FSH3 Putative serine hydrolase [Maudiozyma saulgeensis]|uniref:Similar to Saccharomyces cerevisiae YOR280C FSH3 Putative serine hydrolase n=1 Tax=Maudiozyma saulgeensis TaxID=1789683 RepID=A0A1X7R9F4_9SACH|nr:similar to Saccharomyces cerevisiae YOR280C FSH3 Putative serine hydrolase [Kazachstania saulgeensis]
MTKRILMLHGLAQTGPYFNSKTRNFRTALEGLGYELFYPTAPNRYPAADIPTDLLDSVATEPNSNEVVAWIENDEVNHTYFLPKTTINFLHDYVCENGPFEGVVGFSQGAGVAGYLMTDFNGLLGLTSEEQPTLKFFMSFSGFRFVPETYQEQYNNHIIAIPSLHVKGELDTVTEPWKIESLYNSCLEDSRTILMHGGGHFVPNARGFVKKVVDWLQTVTQEEN